MLCKQMLALREEQFGAEDLGVASILHYLAERYSHDMRYAEKEPLYIRALAIREKLLGDGPETTKSLSALAGLYARQRFAAEPLYKRALAIKERVWGVQHPEVADFLDFLAYFYDRQQRYAEAAECYRRALEIWEKLREEDRIAGILTEHTDLKLAGTLVGLADLYFHYLNRDEEAEPLYKRALELQEKRPGEDLQLAALLVDFANLYFEQKRYEEAEALYKRALAIRERELGEDPETADVLYKLARLCYFQQRYEEVERFIKRSLAILAEKPGADLLTADFLYLQGALCYGQDRYAEAEEYYGKALALFEKIREDPTIAEVLFDLSDLCDDQERYAEALEYAGRALKQAEKLLGADHLRTHSFRGKYNRLLVFMAENEEASDRKEQAE
ncbi:tetratricopeptide repeat-containing protein [Ktedonosporobacter rubrisoli]|uniref:tetratricopeptide repeat-containing protein n=1 Tax=Ktedonosporobacter rubrisoli TaxID=2509675 RepID=UPI001F5D51FA|nr:tetratricopeptide repeat-containing protein [Ktedonosporobacter rubrisoli]